MGDKTVFTDYAIFRKLIIPANGCDFHDKIFQEDLKFNGKFSGRPDFSNAEFMGNVDFSEAQFTLGSDFSKATVSEDRQVSYEYPAEFKGKGTVNFSRAQFTHGANFSKAKFRGGPVSFEKAKFSGDGHVTFKSAEFNNQGEVSFHSATFSNTYKVRSESTRFGNEGDVWFKDATFSNTGNVCFDRATFENQGYVSFDKAEFYNTDFVSFDSVDFNNKGYVWFDSAIFLNKNNVTFNFTNFEKCNRVNFVKSLFSCDGNVEFKNMTTPKNGIAFLGCLFNPSGDKRVVDFTGALFSGALFDGGATLNEKWDCWVNGCFAESVEVLWSNLSPESAKNLTFRMVNLSRSVFDGITLSRIELNAPIWRKRDGRNILYEEDRIEEVKKNGDAGKYKTDQRNLENQYTQLKNNLEKQGNYHHAGDFHIGEQEIRSQIGDRGLFEGCMAWAYRTFSIYGERPKIAGIWLVLLIVYGPYIILIALESTEFSGLI